MSDLRDLFEALVMFLKAAPQAKQMGALRAANTGPEVIRRDGTQLDVVYPAGIGRSKLTSHLIEQKLQTRGTGRNWNTILKLAAVCKAG